MDCKLSWSKHIDTTVAKIGRSLSIITSCSTFLTALSTRQVLQALVLSLLDYCSVVWSGATKNEICNWLRTGQHGWALGCTQRANINNMHVNPSWFKVYERLTSSLLVFMRGIDMLNAPSCLFEILPHNSDTHVYSIRHATRGLFTVPKSRTDYGRCTVLHRAMTTWHSSPHQVTDASRKIRF